MLKIDIEVYVRDRETWDALSRRDVEIERVPAETSLELAAGMRIGSVVEALLLDAVKEALHNRQNIQEIDEEMEDE